MMSEYSGATSSTDLGSTYYGKPVIKAAHWRWLVINYFFLGAVAGGTFIIGVVADLVGSDRKLIRISRYVSLAALLPSPVLLVLDLGRPERALNMLRVIKLRSPMSLGSWALLGLSIFSGLSAMFQLAYDLLGRQIPTGLQRTIGILGLPFAAFISGYTGVLLAVTNVPLWARNYLLMGPTFVASAFSSSFAVLTLILGLGEGEREETAQAVAQAEVICLATETALLTVGLLHLGPLGKPLTTGRWGRLFWPVTYVGGLLIPLAVQLSGPVRGKSGSRSRRTVTALLVLSGGYMLRTLMIFAGRESANRPEDYFAYTRQQT